MNLFLKKNNIFAKRGGKACHSCQSKANISVYGGQQMESDALWMTSQWQQRTKYRQHRTYQRLKRWLGVPLSLTSVWLYSNLILLRIPAVFSVVEKFKVVHVAKCRLVMTLRDSADDRDFRAGILPGTRNKTCSAKTSVDQSKSMWTKELGTV